MKKLIKLPAIVLGLLLLLTGTTQKVMAQDEDISLQSFYDELSPYGTWIQDPQYGYVWRPDADQGDFRPYYTNGRWAMTEYGNTWVSNYDWGWAPFHYGRWVYNRYNQWVWIPDTVWGPAWVSWRSGGGYYGWAPMGPGMNINVNFNIPNLWWVFVPQRNIYYDNFPRYYSRRNMVIINNTTIINHVYTRDRRSYYTGPRADEIRRYTRQAVPVYTVNRTSRPSRSNITGNRLEIYTPNRSARGNNQTAAAPRNVTRGEGYTTMRTPGEARPSRGNTGNMNTDRGNNTPSNREGRISNGSAGQVRPEVPQRTTRGEQGMQTERPERVSRDVQPQRSTETQDAGRQEQAQRQARAEQQVRQQQAAQEQAQRQSRQEQAERQQQSERQEQSQRQEQSRQQQPQRQQEARPAPQPQPQRMEQSRPSRGSESSGGRESNRGGSSSSRPTRGSRG